LVYEIKNLARICLWLRVEFQPGIEGQSGWAYLKSQMAFPLKSSTFPDIYGELKKRLSESWANQKWRAMSKKVNTLNGR